MFGYAAFAQPTFAGLGSNSYLLSLSENFNSNDTITILAQFNLTDIENVSMADSNVWGWIFNNVENVTITESYIAGLVILFSITENVYMLDSLIARGWIKINDNQTANWANVSNAGGGSWTKINDNQTVTWNVINNTNSNTWTAINNAENPGWTPINDFQG